MSLILSSPFPQGKKKKKIICNTTQGHATAVQEIIVSALLEHNFDCQGICCSSEH